MLGIDEDYTLEPSDSSGGAPGSGGRSPVTSSGGSDDGGASASGGAADGGAADGGAQASGGTADGGAQAAGGVGGDASGTGGVAGACGAGKKLCPVMGVEKCVPLDPSNGCGPTGCDLCPFPAGGYSTCEGTVCGIGCHEEQGFVKVGDTCERVPLPDGGNTGTGGRPGTCKINTDCPACGSVAGCCALIPAGVCGCNFVWCVPPPPR